MKQRLADRMPADLMLQSYTYPERKPKPPRAQRLSIQLGGIYKLWTRNGYLVVQVLQFRRRAVMVKEVEDTRRFNVNPANLIEF